MRKSEIKSPMPAATKQVQAIAADKLIAHPLNPNRMSRGNFRKLVRNIKRTGRYEPLVVRPHPEKAGFFQIINGEHRWRALAELGERTADCVVWDGGDADTDILLTTLNRLTGTDELTAKLKILKRLSKRMKPVELAKLLPQTAKQISRLGELKKPAATVTAAANCLPVPLVFFVNDSQREQIEKALAVAISPSAKTNAAKRSAALEHIAGDFLNHSKFNPP